MGQKLGDFLTNREHAPNSYISLITASYIDAPKDLAWLGDTARTQTKSFRQYIDAGMLFT